MPKIKAKFQRVTTNVAPNRGGVGSNGDFRPIFRYIAETVQDRDMVTMEP